MRAARLRGARRGAVVCCCAASLAWTAACASTGPAATSPGRSVAAGEGASAGGEGPSAEGQSAAAEGASVAAEGASATGPSAAGEGAASSGRTDPGSPPAPANAPGPARSAAVGGIYSESQAERGRAAFERDCSACHVTGEFRGTAFQANWGRRTVYSLYRTVRSTMPDDNPGGLAEPVYLDVVAYVLRMNGHPAGETDLTADSPMRDVRIATPEPGR